MPVRPSATRRRRLLTTGVAALAAIAGLVAVAPPSSAHGGSIARTYTSSLAAGPIARDVPTTFALTITNTTASTSAVLDRVRVTVPAGWTAVTAGAVSSPRGGWSASLIGSTLTAKTSKATWALKRTESVTIAFTATAVSSGCAARTDKWLLAVEGGYLGYASQSAIPTTTLAAIANTVSVTSVTSANPPGLPLQGQAVVDRTFDVGVAFTCGGLAAPATTTLELSTTEATGTLTHPSTSVVGQTTATVSGAYSAVVAGLPLTVESSFPDATTSIDIVSAYLAPGDDTTLDIPGATALLPNGANGPVTFTTETCIADCHNSSTQTVLSADFKDDDGNPLYDNEHPATLVQTCPASECTFKGSTLFFSNAYLLTNPFPYNSSLLCFFVLCGPNFSGQAGQSDFASFPVYVSIYKDGADQPFRLAPRCVAQPGARASLSTWQRFFTDTGTISNPDAKALGFCVDVNAITRAGNAFTGDLRVPVLFVEDPKFIITR